MTRVPRASLSIDLLDDADYCALMASRAGREAFAVYVAMLVMGRRMLQQGRAMRVENSAHLRLFDNPNFILSKILVTHRVWKSTLNIISGVCCDNGSSPWLYLDESGRIVIRSFFKYNTETGWGGSRPGAGRPPGNHLESVATESSCAPPVPVPVPVPVLSPLTPHGGERRDTNSHINGNGRARKLTVAERRKAEYERQGDIAREKLRRESEGAAS